MKDGLKVWFNADGDMTTKPGPNNVVAAWKDKSGNHDDGIRDTMFDFTNMPSSEFLPRCVASSGCSRELKIPNIARMQ